MSSIRLRPHHALCAQFFAGKGYDGRFIEHMARILSELAQPGASVTLTDGCDAICSGCPNNRNGVCETDEKVRAIDRRALEATKLSFGDTLPWRALSALANQSIIAPGKLKEVCRDCEWIGLCAAERTKKGEGSMVYQLSDPSKVESLFSGMEDTLIRSCLENVMGKVFVTDPENPKSAMAFLGDFAFYAGEPDAALVKEKPDGFVIMVPPDDAWSRLIEACFPDAEKDTRYAIRKDTRFDRKTLQGFVDALPDGYALRRIDGALFDACLKNGLFEDCVKHFGSKERYQKLGRGFAVLKDGALVSVASSYTAYREGIEIEIDTVPEERRKGLASAVGAKLILSCLDDGLYPSWDAANTDSVRLSEKLGYAFDRAYSVYYVN